MKQIRVAEIQTIGNHDVKLMTFYDGTFSVYIDVYTKQGEFLNGTPLGNLADSPETLLENAKNFLEVEGIDLDLDLEGFVSLKASAAKVFAILDTHLLQGR